MPSTRALYTNGEEFLIDVMRLDDFGDWFCTAVQAMDGCTLHGVGDDALHSEE